MMKKNNADPSTYCRLGHYYLSEEKLPHAETAFYYALKNDVNNTEARYGLGLTWLKQGLIEKAQAVFNRL